MEDALYLLVHKDHTLNVEGINSGAERATIALAEALASLGKRVAVAAQLSDDREEILRNGVHYWNIGREYLVETALDKAQREGKFYLISAGRAYPILLSRSYSNCNKRLLICHDPSGTASGISNEILCAVCDKIISVSEAQKDLFVASGASPEKVEVIYNGVDHSLFSDGGRENRDYNKIVFVGALVMDKGVHLLLNAFHQIRANHPKLSLDIYGSSSMWDREELFDTEQIEREMPGVKFHGAVPQEEIAAAFKGAGLCVIPSIWFDSFPLTAVEAQACGCPVVCFRVGGIPEAIDNGSTGIVIEEISPEALAETLNNLLSDTDRLRKLSKNAAVWAKERFSWINVAKSVSRICEGENTNAGEKTPYFQGTIATGRFGFLSTWNQNCGLATYGRYFLENFPKGSYIVFGEKSNRDAPDEEFVVRCWKRRSRDFSELDSAITKSGIKLLYLNCHYNFFPQPEFSRFLRKIRDRGIKVIAHIHNPYTVDSALQALITSVDHVVVHTPENALEIVANGGAPDRVTVIPHGVKIHDRLDPQQCKEALGVPADENLIVSFGFIQPHKGIEGLIEGIAHLNSKGICAHGIVVGGIHKEDPNSEAYFNSLLNLCDSLGVKDRVRFTGDFVPDSDVPTYLYGADVVLMNYGSQHYEASGACSLAIGAGSVVAASIAPPFLPFRDAVWHITSGYPLTLSLELLLTNRTLRDRIKKAAQAYKQKNAWPEITRKVNNLFKKVGFKAEAAKRGGTGEIKVRVLREERRVMRVLMQNRPTAYEQPGGDTVVMDRLKEGLEKRGVYVDIDLTGEADISKYNLVHLFNFATPDYTRMLARRAYEKGVPYVVTALCEDVASFHNQSHVCAEFMKEYVRRGQDREWYVSSKPDYKAIESSGSFDAGWIAENASAVFVTGAKEGQVIKRLYPNTAPIKVVKLGYEVRMEGDPNLFINRYGVRDFVLCVGRLESRKNQLMLLKALEDVSLPLVLIGGDFSYQPDYAQAVRLFKRSGETLVLGRLPEEMLASAYAAAKVHALPSWYELPGLVSLEAGFYGCNIVACNRGTIYDYLGDRVFYCNPEDEDSIRRAVLMAFQRPNQSGLKEVIMENTWDKAAEKTLETYQRIAGKPLEDSSDRSETTIDLGRGVYDMDGGATEFQELVEKGELATKHRKLEEAHNYLNQALKMNQNSPRLMRVLGALYLSESKVEDAENYFAKAIALDPEDTKSMTGFAMCKIMQGDHKTAHPILVRALSKEPTAALSMHQLLECSFALGQYDEVISALRRYIAIKPSDAEMTFCLAGCLYKAGEIEEARSMLKSVLEISPGHKGAIELRDRIECESTMGENTNSAAGREDVAPPQQKSDKNAPQIVQNDAFTVSIDVELEKLNEQKKKRELDGVKEGCKKIIESGRCSSTQLLTAKALLAETSILEGDLASANRLYDEILGEDPTFSRAICGRAALRANEGSWDEAEDLFSKALQFDGSSDVAYAGLGTCCQQKGDNTSAWSYYQKALAINPENSRALLGTIETGYQLGNLDGIEAAIKGYLEMHPIDPNFLYSLAGCYYAQGRYAEAQEEIEKILLFDPEHANALELRDAIAEKMGIPAEQQGFGDKPTV